MATCTFFGHRDCPETIRLLLRSALVELITTQSVDTFYVGNHGHFDALVHAVLKELAEEYPHIRYTVVLAYMPGRKDEYTDYSHTMLPEGIETVPSRYAISRRNDWMLRQADYVVTYITHLWGGAAQYAAKAQRQEKHCVNLSLQERSSTNNVEKEEV